MRSQRQLLDAIHDHTTAALSVKELRAVVVGPAPWPEDELAREQAKEELRLRGESLREPEWPQYDVEEMTVLARMKKILREKHGLTDEDFEGQTFTDIEAMFLDEFGEPDFRPPGD